MVHAGLLDSCMNSLMKVHCGQSRCLWLEEKRSAQKSGLHRKALGLPAEAGLFFGGFVFTRGGINSQQFVHGRAPALPPNPLHKATQKPLPLFAVDSPSDSLNHHCPIYK